MHFNKVAYLLVFFLLLQSCSDNEVVSKNEIDKSILDPNSSINANFDGKIFSIPSPFQMSLLLNETVRNYSPDILHDPAKVESYLTDFSRALNLGVYSADLAYTCVNNQNNTSLNYLSSIESLTSKIGLEFVFDKNFMQRFDKNKSNLDSSMVILTEAFRKTDDYLKSEDRKPVSALILIGGWVETLHFATEINVKERNEKVIHHIGEQKQTVATIIDILKEYNFKGNTKKLQVDFTELKFYFDQIDIQYEYLTPITDVKSKKTILRHKLIVNVSDKILVEIADKIDAIRNNIVLLTN